MSALAGPLQVVPDMDDQQVAMGEGPEEVRKECVELCGREKIVHLLFR